MKTNNYISFLICLVAFVCNLTSCSVDSNKSEDLSYSCQLKDMLKKAFCYPRMYDAFYDSNVSMRDGNPYINKGRVLLRDKDGSLVHINEDGEIVKALHDSIEVNEYLWKINFPNSLFPFKGENDCWGLKDINGNIIHEPIIETLYLNYFRNRQIIGLADREELSYKGYTFKGNFEVKKDWLIIRSADNHFVINMNDTSIVLPPHEFTDVQYDNRYFIAKSRKNNKLGLYNGEGEELLPCEYDVIDCESLGMNDMVMLRIDDKFQYGVIKDEHEISLSRMYDYGGTIQHGRAEVERNGRAGCIGIDGDIITEIIPCMYYASDIEPLSHDVFAHWTDEKYAILNSKNEYLTAHNYTNIVMWDEFHIVVKDVNGKYGVLDKYGREAVPFKYDYVAMHNDIICIEDNGRYGAVTKNNEELIPCLYEEYEVFNHGSKDGWRDVYVQVKTGETCKVYNIYKSVSTLTDYSNVDMFNFYDLKICVLSNKDKFEVKINDTYANYTVYESIPFEVNNTEEVKKHLISICSVIANYLLGSKNSIDMNDYILGNIDDSNVPLFLFNEDAFKYIEYRKRGFNM